MGAGDLGHQPTDERGMSPANGSRNVRERIRTTAGRVRLARRASLPGRAAEFARALMRRYVAGQVSSPALNLILRRPWPGVMLHRISHRTQIYLAPRLTLTGLSWSGQRRADDRSAGGSAPAALKPRLEPQVGIPSVRQVPVASFASTAVHGLVRRLAGRSERIEPGRLPAVSLMAGALRTWNTGADRERSPQGERDVEARPWRPPAHVIPMVFRRPAATATQSGADGSLPDKPRPVAHGRPWTAEGGCRTASPEAIDVNRLTDQVIQTIDRRIVAQRERMGRL